MTNQRKPRYGLIRATKRAHVRDLSDYDYLKQLSDAELDWLDKFSREYYGGQFNKDDKDNLHKTREQRRAIWRDDNARRRDIWNGFFRIPNNIDRVIELSTEDLLDLGDEDESK